MDPDLYFISLLKRALTGPDLKSRLKAALDGIEALGKESRYYRGREQLGRFLKACRSAQEKEAVLLGLLHESYEAPTELDRDAAGCRPSHIVVWRDDKFLAKVDLPVKGVPSGLAGLVPGRYRICHEGGWLLWEGELTRGELLLGTGDSRPMLRVAAATGEAGPDRPTMTLAILKGELAMRIEPGEEFGSIIFVYSGV